MVVVVGGVRQHANRGTRQYKGGGGHKRGGSAPLCQLYKKTLKISHSLHYKITTNSMLGYSGAALGLNLRTQYTRTIIYRYCNTASFIL